MCHSAQDHLPRRGSACIPVSSFVIWYSVLVHSTMLDFDGKPALHRIQRADEVVEKKPSLKCAHDLVDAVIKLDGRSSNQPLASWQRVRPLARAEAVNTKRQLSSR